MKYTFKTIMALICCALTFSCTDQIENEAVKSVITADMTSINEVAAQNPSDVSITLTSNVTWIVETPSWVTASKAYGHGDAILTFAFATNYKNETTTTQPRSGMIRIMGGGSLTGDGVTLEIPVSQLGYTYVDPNAPIGHIPDVDEFVDFLKAIMAGNAPTRWTNDAGEVSLEADIDLSGVNYDWTTHVVAVKNANNDCTVEGPAFAAVFNGNGHKITGFNPTVVLEANQTFGLFPALNGGVVKNVDLTGEANITAKDQADAGLLVGTALNSTIQNVTVNGSIVSAGTTASKRFAIGGVVGFSACTDPAAPTLIENATSNVDVDFVGGTNTANGAGCAMYGGIVGFSTTPKNAEMKVTIKGCVNNGDMNVTLGRCSGILATANCGTTLDACTNNGNQVNKIANGRLGNIVCNVSLNCHLKDCVNNGDLDATVDGYSGTVGGIFALAGDASSTITGGGNYGTIKTLSTAGKYIGLLWANHNNAIPTSGLVASGRIFVDGVEREITSANYMEHLGSIKNPDFVTDIVWVAPK